MKILYVTTIGLTTIFFKDIIKELLDNGHSVDIACNSIEEVDDFYQTLDCNIYKIDCLRFPLHPMNVKAAKQIKKLVSENGYDIVHCHTPVAGVCTRMACRGLRKNGLRVFYTAHGFHFFKGAPLKNWLIFYPIELFCSRFTDTLITITREDYELAKRKMKAGKIEYVPGVGIDVESFRGTEAEKASLRGELNIPADAFVLLSVGELNENKNHRIVIKALAEINNPSIYYIVAGSGALQDELNSLAKELGVDARVKLLGYRNDVNRLYKAADVYVLPSKREGLNVSVMEAMASGLPVICSKIRGNVDMVSDENGALCTSDDVESYKATILGLLGSSALPQKANASLKAAQKYDKSIINKKMFDIYFLQEQ